MAKKCEIASIYWDQKQGGMLEFTSNKKLKLSSATTMNLYNMHRIRQKDPNFGMLRLRLEDGEQYNVSSFFTGYGASTSPDGFTANYGKNIIGLAERVICLFLPLEAKPQDYEEVMAKISSRIVLDASKMQKKINKITDIINGSGVITKPDELNEYLNKFLDKNLKLDDEKIVYAKNFEVKSLHYLIADKKDHIKELTINPAKTSFQRDEKKIAEANKMKSELQKMIKQRTSMSAQQEITNASSSTKDEGIDQLKMDYIKIFGTLTDQISLLENEINGITESTRAFVQDLNGALAEKIARVNELEQELREKQ